MRGRRGFFYWLARLLGEARSTPETNEGHQRGEGPSQEAESQGLGRIVNHAWDVIQWHNQRVQDRDRLVTEIMAFSGVILALMPNVIDPLSRVASEPLRVLLTLGVLLSILLFASAVLLSLTSAAAPPRRELSAEERGWLRRQWDEHKSGPARDKDFERELGEYFIENPGVYHLLVESADKRVRLTRWAALMLGSGLVVLAVTLVGLTLAGRG